MKTTSGTTLVLLTADDPEQLGAALGSLLPTLPAEGVVLRVLTHGEHAGALSVAALHALTTQRPDAMAAPAPGQDRLTAISGALPELLAEHPEAEQVALVAQGVRVAPGWLGELLACLRPGVVHGMGARTVEGLDSVGIVAPCMDHTPAEAQRLTLESADVQMGLSAYAAARLAHFAGSASLADVVGGGCVLITREAVNAATQGVTPMLHPGLGAWAWADLCLRASGEGFRTVVSEAAFVAGTAPSEGTHAPGNAKHRLEFYSMHHSPREQRVIAVVLAKFQRWHDVQTLRACLGRLAPLVDGVAIVATTNPLDVQSDPEFAAVRKRLPAMDNRLLKGCNGASVDAVAAALSEWADKVMGQAPGRSVGKLSVRATAYTGPADLRMQRNAGLRLAGGLAPTAVLMLAQDEFPEQGVTRETVHRMLAHPNPLVRCFDVGFVTHHGTPALVRVDAPWGHGGSYAGAPHGPRLYRLQGRSTGLLLRGEAPPAIPDHGIAAHRVAALRLRRMGEVRPADRARLGITDAGEGMRLDEWRADNRIGLHLLVYEAENPEDVARWLDAVHALVDHVVLVWTGEWAEADKLWTVEGKMPEAWPATGPGQVLAQVAQAHGAEFVHEPLNDNIAQARNAGIHALHDRKGLAWALFIDPDEWMPSPLNDAAALRSMAQSSRWGWLMQVANYRPDQEVPTLSDSVRMSRLDPARQMLMDGRVHEGFGKSIAALQARGIHPRLTYAPFTLQHRGLAQDDDSMAAKLAKYDHLLRLQLADSPHDPGAWVSLGWHYLNDGHEAQGIECYRRALACAGTSYLPYKEMAFHHLRAARAMLDGCDARLTEGHQFYPLLQRMRGWLEQYAPPHPVVGAPGDAPPAPLPVWQAPGDEAV